MTAKYFLNSIQQNTNYGSTFFATDTQKKFDAINNPVKFNNSV
jgi:hypothetical protein